MTSPTKYIGQEIEASIVIVNLDLGSFLPQIDKIADYYSITDENWRSRRRSVVEKLKILKKLNGKKGE